MIQRGHGKNLGLREGEKVKDAWLRGCPPASEEPGPRRCSGKPGQAVFKNSCTLKPSCGFCHSVGIVLYFDSDHVLSYISWGVRDLLGVRTLGFPS